MVALKSPAPALSQSAGKGESVAAVNPREMFAYGTIIPQSAGATPLGELVSFRLGIKKVPGNPQGRSPEDIPVRR